MMDSLAERMRSIGLEKYAPALVDECITWEALVECHHIELLGIAHDASMDAESKMRFLNYVLPFAGPLSAPHILIDVWPHHPTASASAPAPCIAIACMTKRPGDMRGWLTHHRDRVGVRHFFLRVEETPELAELIAQPEWADCVHATFAAGKTARDCGGAQCARQDAHIQWSIDEARQRGCTHLLHCDDDELFYCPHGARRFHELLRSASARLGRGRLC